MLLVQLPGYLLEDHISSIEAFEQTGHLQTLLEMQLSPWLDHQCEEGSQAGTDSQ